MGKQYKLIEDRTWNGEPEMRVVHTGTYDECLVAILKKTPWSTEQALNKQGYKIIQAK